MFPRNREKAKKARGRRFWCDHCDRNMVSEGEKCSVCGKRSGLRRREKISDTRKKD